ncbi:MAG: FAD-dependent monooxygenase [Betaproteobacteria bacterium]
MQPILIAGGGIGGIATALCLRARGVPFELYEQADAFREVGAGIQLSANAMRILMKLGLGADLAHVAVMPRGLEVRSWQSGERILWTPLGYEAERHFGAPYYHAHRAEVLEVLVRALGNDAVNLGRKFVSVAEDGEGVALVFDDGTRRTGRIVVGADGIHSVLRQQLFGSGAPRFSGNVAWRGTLPSERVADLKLEHLSSNWWGPGRSLVHYFISAGRTHNWIGVGRSDTPSRESWSATGSVDEALEEYAGWHPQVRAVIAATTRLYRMALYDREPLATWRAGRVVLLGDAAHAMLPYHAQGAAQSIEDAYVLAGCIAATPDAPLEATARYESLRKERAEWVQQFSRDAEELFNMADPARVARRDARLRENQQTYAGGFPDGQQRIYGYDADAALAGTAQEGRAT